MARELAPPRLLGDDAQRLLLDTAERFAVKHDADWWVKYIAHFPCLWGGTAMYSVERPDEVWMYCSSLGQPICAVFERLQRRPRVFRPGFPFQPRYQFDCMSPMVWKHDGAISWGDEDTLMVRSRLRLDGVGYSTNASPDCFDVYVRGHPQRQFSRVGEARPRKLATAASSKREQAKKDMPWITDDDLNKAFGSKKTHGGTCSLRRGGSSN